MAADIVYAHRSEWEDDCVDVSYGVHDGKKLEVLTEEGTDLYRVTYYSVFDRFEVVDTFTYEYISGVRPKKTWDSDWSEQQKKDVLAREYDEHFHRNN